MASGLEPALGPGDLILSDFDGVISLKDVGVETITRLGLDEAWDLEHQWRRQEISSSECLAQQWAMVRLAEEELYALLDSMPLDESFVDFVELCKQREASLAVLSDGLDLYVDRMLGRLGLRTAPGTVPLLSLDDCLPVFVNHGEWTPQGVQVTFPLAWPGCDACGNCKTAHLFALRPGYRRVIYLGDGYSDLCSAPYADVVFAKGYLADFCQQRRLPFFPFQSFSEVIQALQ